MKFLDKSAQTLNNKMHVRVEVLRDFDSSADLATWFVVRNE